MGHRTFQSRVSGQILNLGWGEAGGTPHIPVEGKNNNQQCTGKVGRVGTLHMEMCSDVHHRVGTPHIKCVQMSSKGGDTAHKMCADVIKGWGHRT